jgi:hypothetical protein
METLSKTEGIKILPKIWTIFLSQKSDLWAEPFSNRKLRFRCFFEKSNGLAKRLTVYFHLSEKELANEEEILESSDTIYLYGAFNQVTVCQVRSFGNIRMMTEEEKTNFVTLMKKRFSRKKSKSDTDKLPLAMSFQELREALLLLKSGKFYCFEPLDYAYHVYEWG